MKLRDENITYGQAKALARYQVISAYLALEPARGQKRKTLEQLAQKTWTGPDGEPFAAAADTIRVWVRRYQKKGLAGLEDKARPRRGIQAITAEQIELACKLKKEVPERTIERIIAIMETMGHVTKGMIRRSTLHRALQAKGLSARACRIPDTQDLDRFQAEAPNDLWQSDMLTGPWLKDPARPNKMRRAYLYAFLDDHSRLLLHGRFSFKGESPQLELVFRRALQKYGLCKRLYYDNAQVYRSNHMRQIVATLGIHGIIHSRPYRPQGHGKIEALNRYIRGAFLAELKASKISTLDQLNEAFVAWADLQYNQRVHSETNEAPLVRWQRGLEKVRYVDEERLRQAFLWQERRTPDKAGVFSLFGIRYQVGPELARRRIQVRYDPEALELIEVWHNDLFVQRVRPFEVQPHRRPKPKEEDPSTSEQQGAITCDWLGALVKKRRMDNFDTPLLPIPEDLQEQNQALLELLLDMLDEAIVDETIVQDYLLRYGPFDLELAQQVLNRFVEQGQKDLHVLVYLEAIRKATHGDAA